MFNGRKTPAYPAPESRLARAVFTAGDGGARTFHPIKVVDLELARPIRTIDGLENYATLQAIVRLHGTPLGYVKVPVTAGRAPASHLAQAVLNHQSWPIMQRLLCDALASPRPDGLRFEHLVEEREWHRSHLGPLVTVAVCTRDHPDDLAQCLDAVTRVDYANLDILVVDNAPTTDATEQLVRSRYPSVRYVREPRPGLNWARNRAIIEARGEILAYTDDDVIVDSRWVTALAAVFGEDPGVAAVTGLVVPYELETTAQILFERNTGFGRGFQRRWCRAAANQSVAAQYGGTGQFGTGANMAFRRSVFDDIGHFDPALDVGTVTNGGGDLEMFFRVLKGGHTLVYEPGAMVRHCHRRDYGRLREQLANNGIGLYSYFVRSALAYPEERRAFFRLGLWWFWKWSIRRFLLSLVRPTGFPRELILGELVGSLVGLGRYQQARKAARRIADQFGPQTPEVSKGASSSEVGEPSIALAVRSVDLAQPLRTLSDVTTYAAVRVFVTCGDRLLGSISIANEYQPVSATRLREAIVEQVGLKLLETDGPVNKGYLWARAVTPIVTRYISTDGQADGNDPIKLPAHVSASVVVATLDRPDDLRNCLRCLREQVSPRRVEIVVVDNNPASGLTPPVVAEFPGVVLVNEPRRGLAYARNKGFVTCTGDIAIATDDDVILQPDWLEKLVAPFVRDSVMIVTANVLPFELETEAQQFFETYGGLGRGFVRQEYDGDWFDGQRSAVPTWHIGATANAAFRTTIFSHPQIGLMDEALGPGMPSGVGEDTYLFYKVLRAGYTIVYEPTAYVWHKHRRGMRALRRLIYNYSKGHVSYHLTTLLRDRDLRALIRIGYTLPYGDLWRIKQRLFGRSDFPWSLIVLEIAGHLAGPWCLWRSRRRVKREGRSDTYIPVALRQQPERAAALDDTYGYSSTMSSAG